MDRARFVDETFGRVTREPGNRHSIWYFQPAVVPRRLPLDDDTVYALSEADSALGNLKGLNTLVRDPTLLLGPYLTREAVASSRIEGTQTSLSQMLQAEAIDATSATEETAEVERYIRATHLGVQLIKDQPLTQRLVKSVHSVLLSGVRGEEKLPGEFRRSPVWVGSPTASPDTAVYVPPLHPEIPALVADWERFVNEPSAMPTLIRCALMHYQFETIHPFLDGNGRIGRLLIGLMLIDQGKLDTPLLYLSGYLEANRREYYDRLQGVRERGEIQQWLQFFLTAVRRQSEDALTRAAALVALRERYRTACVGVRSSLPTLVDLVFRNPYLTVSTVQRETGLTNQGARNLVKEAEKRGWVEELGNFGRGGRTYWYAQEVFRIIESPNVHGSDRADGDKI
ncbi:MAG: Fic family protein [Sporichthyaceae bacterium]